MSRRYQDLLPFSPQYDFMAFKPITYLGVTYQHGERFPPEGMEAEDLPSESLLEKLYRQKRIVVYAAPDQADLTPGPIQDSLNADAAAAAESGQAGGTETTGTEGQNDAPENTPDGERQHDSAGDQRGTDGGNDAAPVEGAAAAPAAPAGGQETPPAAAAPAGAEKPPADAPKAEPGKLLRVNKGFGKHDVVDDTGAVVASALSKADADAMVKAGKTAA